MAPDWPRPKSSAGMRTRVSSLLARKALEAADEKQNFSRDAMGEVRPLILEALNADVKRASGIAFNLLGFKIPSWTPGRGSFQHVPIELAMACTKP